MFKPLLAPRDSQETRSDFFDRLPYPLLCAPKLDGIRALTKDGVVKSRTFKELPSYQVQGLFRSCQGLDGEIIIGRETDFDVYNRTQSHVMSFDKPAEQVRLFVFDWVKDGVQDLPFFERLQEAHSLAKHYNMQFAREGLLIPVEHTEVRNKQELFDYEEWQVGLGFEGVMMRGRNGRYKQGRATYNEGIIYKFKRFIDDEGEVIDFEEAQHNMNELETNELGYAKRSHHQENKVGAGRVGTFIVKYQGEIIRVAPGNFIHADLIDIWNNKGKFINKWLKFRYFGHGIKDLPRHPRAIGWRDLMDM